MLILLTLLKLLSSIEVRAIRWCQLLNVEAFHIAEEIALRNGFTNLTLTGSCHFAVWLSKNVVGLIVMVTTQIHAIA